MDFKASCTGDSYCRNGKCSRIQSLMKAVELELDQEDWFAIWTESIVAMT
jgi:predicted oxidoreductase